MEIDPAKVDPKHLKISYAPAGGKMSRRDLIFGLLRPRYEIVPAVEKERCAAWRGCSVCLASCPGEAISLREGSAFIDKEKCTACGACLPSCPEDAISSPLLDPEVLDNSLQSLLRRDERDLQPKALVITSEDSAALLESATPPLSSGLLELKLPCIGALSPWLLLRAFDLGVEGVAIIPCSSTCRHRCKPERWQHVVRFVQALLVKLGMESETVRLFCSPFEGARSLGDLLGDFLDEVKGKGPSKLRNGQGREKKLTLLSLLKDFGRRFGLDGTRLAGDEIPFGIVTVETGDNVCTLCGACPDRCPTGAISLKEEADLSQLLFSHSRCIGCGTCIKICPEQVLRVERALDFSRLTETVVLAEGQTVRCERCGASIAPEGLVTKVQHLLGPQAPDLRLCPSCRLWGPLERSGPR